MEAHKGLKSILFDVLGLPVPAAAAPGQGQHPSATPLVTDDADAEAASQHGGAGQQHETEATDGTADADADSAQQEVKSAKDFAFAARLSSISHQVRPHQSGSSWLYGQIVVCHGGSCCQMTPCIDITSHKSQSCTVYCLPACFQNACAGAVCPGLCCSPGCTAVPAGGTKAGSHQAEPSAVCRRCRYSCRILLLNPRLQTAQSQQQCALQLSAPC